MAKQIRKVFRRSYDKCIASDYIGDVDNLNPKRNTELETQVNEIINECRSRLNKIEKKYNLEDEVSKFTVRSSSLDDMQKEIDALLRSLNNNPAKRLSDIGFNPQELVGSDAFEDLGSPLSVNCYGIDTLGSGTSMTVDYAPSSSEGSDEDEDADKDAETEGLTDSQLDKVYTITYNVNGANNITSEQIKSWPQTYTMRSHSFALYSRLTFPQSSGKTYQFGGWYLDPTFSEKIKNNIFKGYNRNVTLYAKKYCPEDDIVDSQLDDDEEEDNISANNNKDAKTCAIQELEWLKIVLVIVTIIKILLMIVTTVLGIIVPLMNIIKEAQLAWINPPLMASIINRVSQKLMALVFSIIGTLLMKLWSLLNFDCLSEAASDTLAQISSVLSGIGGVMDGVDELALTIKNTVGYDWSQFAEDTKKNLSDQWKEMCKGWNKDEMAKKFGAAWGEACGEWAAVFSDPNKLYNAAVPAEIRDTISDLISQYQDVSDQCAELYQKGANMGAALKGEEKKVPAKGTTETSVEPSQPVDSDASKNTSSDPTVNQMTASARNKKQKEKAKKQKAIDEAKAASEDA